MAYYRNRYHRHPSGNRFTDYRELVARRDGPADCRPGHTVSAGDTIGWNGGLHRVHCSACWHVWKSENRDAELYEREYERIQRGW